ncbi:hypothetical protein [Providencia stuartii]|uniref:hypothetical protein n=1 Tax=Providencia stuartii TaxID=588 RepID=UPI00214D193E
MNRYPKINRPTDGHLFQWMNKLLLIGGILLSCNGVSMASNTMSEIYTINLSSNNAGCGVKINEMLVMENADFVNGNYSSGQNISSMLTNGTNTLGLIMYNGSIINREEKLTPDMWCNVELNKLSKNGDSTFISGIKLIGDEDGKLVVAEKYQKNGDQIYFGGPSRDSEYDVLEAKNQFNLQGLPEWQWEKATPVTEADIPKIQAFYLELQQAFASKDLEKLKDMGKISWDEFAFADNSTPDTFWYSLNFEERLNQGYKPSPIDWDEYDFTTYEDKRIFRYEVGFHRLSPLELISPEGKNYFYNPYLSIIDGKVTIVR